MPDERDAPMNVTPTPDRYPWHDPLWSVLVRHIDQLPHALMFHGLPGLGKSDFARQLAQVLLCERPTSAAACGTCHGCRLFTAGNHPDFYPIGRVGDARTISVDQIRSLGDYLALRPHTSPRRVIVIAPAETMTLNAANSLLKLLEEPPLGSLLMLVTSHPARLPATIVSRCARVHFRTPAIASAQTWLQAQAESEAQTAHLLEMAGGAPLQAQALMREDFPRRRNLWLADLAALTQGREHPVTCATRWKSTGPTLALGWLHGFAVDLLRLRLGDGQTPRLNPEATSIHESIKNKYEINELFSFIDVILENYRRLNSPLDEQLMLEEVLIHWARLSRLQ